MTSDIVEKEVWRAKLLFQKRSVNDSVSKEINPKMISRIEQTFKQICILICVKEDVTVEQYKKYVENSMKHHILSQIVGYQRWHLIDELDIKIPENANYNLPSYAASFNNVDLMDKCFSVAKGELKESDVVPEKYLEHFNFVYDRNDVIDSVLQSDSVNIVEYLGFTQGDLYNINPEWYIECPNIYKYFEDKGEKMPGIDDIRYVPFNVFIHEYLLDKEDTNCYLSYSHENIEILKWQFRRNLFCKFDRDEIYQHLRRHTHSGELLKLLLNRSVLPLEKSELLEIFTENPQVKEWIENNL